MRQQLEYLQAELCIREERISSDEMQVLKGRIGVNVAKVNRLGKLRKVKNARPHSFYLDEDTSNYGAYQKGGIVTCEATRSVILEAFERGTQ